VIRRLPTRLKKEGCRWIRMGLVKFTFWTPGWVASRSEILEVSDRQSRPDFALQLFNLTTPVGYRPMTYRQPVLEFGSACRLESVAWRKPLYVVDDHTHPRLYSFRHARVKSEQVPGMRNGEAHELDYSTSQRTSV